MDLAIYLDSSAPTPLYLQLTAQLRTAMLQGTLRPDQRLPASRALAQQLHISRSTVTQSYEQLASEGYLVTRCGSGTYVCDRLPDSWLELPQPRPVTDRADSPLSLSRLGTKLEQISKLQHSEPNYAISFRYGNPASNLFPIGQWRKLLTRHCQNDSASLNYFPDSGGYPPLRREVAQYLRRSRGVNCTPEQVIMVNGSQQALDLLSRIMLDPDDWVAMEEPGYLGARHCFQGQFAQVQPIPLQPDGLDIAALSNCTQKFKLVYVTPSHQFPTGITMTLPQRIALLQWAEQTQTMIIEDDYDSEYRYESQPIPALQGMDRSQSVIYVGTFSKVLFPALRIGYLVVPPAWIPILTKAN